jgi:DNA-binding XRE family transcriptional regulator
MENLAERKKEALRLVERLIELDPDTGTMHYALKMRERLKLPMSVVLDKYEKEYPELTVIERAEKLGVTRQAYYSWINGIARPNTRAAKKLAGMTGYTAEDIRGKLPSWRTPTKG